MIAYPITNFVAEVDDIDLSQTLSDEQQKKIFELIRKFSVLVFPNQSITQQQHIAFAKIFGTVESSIEYNLQGAAPRLPKELSDVSNLSSQGEIWTADSSKRKLILANRLWHTDSSFRNPSACLTFLHAKSIPPVGGHTEFADTVAAFEALDSLIQNQLRSFTAEHSIINSRNKLGFYSFKQQELDSIPPVYHPIVLTDVESGKESLYISSHIGEIRGSHNSEQLLTQLIAHATQRQFVYTHRWRAHDLVVWNNFKTVHRGTEFDDLKWCRDFQRATVINN